MPKMDIALWMVQILLAALFGVAGFIKVFQTKKLREQWKWARGESPVFLRFLGASELLGTAGMILPLLMGILPWLTPLVAIGFGFIQLMAIIDVDYYPDDFNFFPLNILLLSASIFVMVGRWPLLISLVESL